MRLTGIRSWTQVLALSLSALLCCAAPASADATPRTAPTPSPSAGSRPLAEPPAGNAGDLIDPVWEFRSRVATDGPADHLAVELENVATGQQIHRTSPDIANWACPTGVWVLRMTRQLNFVSSTIIPLCNEFDATVLDARLKVANEKAQDGVGRDHNEMVIVNSLNRAPGGKPFTLRGLPAALGRIGVAGGDFTTLDLSQTAFSAWGVPGMSAGQGYAYRAPAAEDRQTAVGALSPAGIKGGFLKDSQQNFALEVSDFRLYDIDAQGGITLNHRRYPVPVEPAGFTGGFHVMVVDNRTLQVASDRLYSTNGDPAGFTSFGADMARLAATSDPSVLVFLASVGNPSPDPTKAGPLGLPDNCTYGTAFVVTCRYTPTEENERGSEQQFTVPKLWQGSPVEELRVRLQGGHGGGARHGGVGGTPAQVSAVLPVDGRKLKGGDTLYVEVGGHGVDGASNGGGVGGFNGGAAGSGSNVSFADGWPGGGGGGASDIRTVSRLDPDPVKTRLSRLLIAGGGGGAGGDSYYDGPGGDGGQAGADGTSGKAGTDVDVTGGGGGQSGTQTAGGAGGSGARRGTNGEFGDGGAGGSKTDVYSGSAGGGGGGYFGGGSGGMNYRATDLRGGGGGGGGGGSSFVRPGGSVDTVAQDEQAFVEISYTTPNGTLADVLRPFGATPTVVSNLSTYPRYALVGRPASPAEQKVGVSPDSPEASGQIYAGATGRLQGVLQPGHDGEFGSITSFVPFRPTVGDREEPEVATSYDLYDIRSNVDQEWTVPVAGNAGQAAALRYLSQRACRCDDIRTFYKAQEETLTDWAATIRSLDYASVAAETPRPDFDEQAFTAVRTALLGELADAVLVHGLSAKMETLLTQQNLFSTNSLKSVYEQIHKSLEPPKGSHLTEAVTDLLLEVVGISSELLGIGKVVGPVVGLFGAGLNLGMELANDENGNDYDAVGSTAEELEADLGKQFTESLTAQSQMFSEIYANQGKLHAVAEGLRKNAPAWDLQLQNSGRLVEAANSAATLSFWRALVGVSFQRYEAKGAPTGDLDHWCIGKDTFNHCHMAGIGKNGQNLSYGGFVLGKNAYSYRTLAPGLTFGEGFDNLMVATPQNGSSDIEPMSPGLMSGDPGDGTKVKGLTVASITAAGGYAPYVLLRWPMVTGLVCPQTVTVSGFHFYARGSTMECGTANLSSPPVLPPLKVTTKALPSAKVGRHYGVQLRTSDGRARQHRWKVASGRLPRGLRLSGHGRLTGTPRSKGTYRFTVRVDHVAGQALKLRVQKARR